MRPDFYTNYSRTCLITFTQRCTKIDITSYCKLFSLFLVISSGARHPLASSKTRVSCSRKMLGFLVTRSTCAKKPLVSVLRRNALAFLRCPLAISQRSREETFPIGYLRWNSWSWLRTDTHSLLFFSSSFLFSRSHGCWRKKIQKKPLYCSFYWLALICLLSIVIRLRWFSVAFDFHPSQRALVFC